VPILNHFEYARPHELREVFQLAAKHPSYAILAGGTDLTLFLKEGLIQPEIVIDTKGLPAFKNIAEEKNTLFLGAGVTFTDLLESEMIRQRFPVIVEVAQTVASVGIRNRATLVGNICSAVPCMDSGPLLVAYEASIQVESAHGHRAIPVKEWFIAPRKTALKPGELVTGISLPVPDSRYASCWVKLGRYTGEDLAQVSVMVLALSDGTYRISFGAVAPVPVRASAIEECLNGRELTPALIDQAVGLVEETIKPITDVRASKEYRMHMAKVMLTRGIQTAVSRLNGNGPDYGTSVL